MTQRASVVGFSIFVSAVSRWLVYLNNQSESMTRLTGLVLETRAASSDLLKKTSFGFRDRLTTFHKDDLTHRVENRN